MTMKTTDDNKEGSEQDPSLSDWLDQMLQKLDNMEQILEKYNEKD